MADLLALVLLTRDLVSLALGPGAEQWGIFLDGEPVVSADSVVTFEYGQDSSISNYPVEQGSFESYNKVATPFDVRVRYAAGGSEANRRSLIDSVAAIMDSLDLFDVVTPEVVYQNCNPVRENYRRTAVNGRGLLQVDIALEEVRVTATSTSGGAGAPTKTPSGADAVGGGNVLPQDPTPGELGQIPGVQ